ncbi:Ldh family oxidoreductase [Sediminicurvatus halobius]|uniref:Sulfolactate dehydrogenase n=1 Tax=Sediminicurvatus halobius TaxID=2182432 RepID=A0A2U2N8D3_9GAMM|nr:Ldh family oxidoreductase [Spiribacter halobius]PWG65441.1 sulfolactate dehydrogenase [Spiribacter halobius]UEX76461.1 Ldh family oxidoreductase [Spiribacter halobius]
MTRHCTPEELRELVTAALERVNVRADGAAAVARALVAAECDELASHGLSRVAFYADQAASGKVDGQAEPKVEAAGAVVNVDAADGFAYLAIERGLETALARVGEQGIVAVGVGNSHHFGVAGHHVERIAEAGCIGIAFGNTPAAMAPWGGRRPLFGTNPIAFAAPRAGQAPLVMDLSLSRVARGKIMLAQREGQAIPEGWALDADGQPTTDPEAALAGSMVPLGEAKGSALALMVEILAGALTGSRFGFEAGSFFTAEGDPPRVGQLFLVLDPAAFGGAGDFAERLEHLLGAVAAEPGTRLPGARRLAARERIARDGIAVSDAAYADLRRRAGRHD